MTELRDHQMQLERLYNKNQLMPRMRKEFIKETSPNFCAYFEHIGLDMDFGIDALVQLALHKRADLQTMVGTLRHHCTSAQEVADNLLLMAEHDCINYEISTGKFIVIYELSEDVQQELDSFQYPLPMVIKPRILKDNYDTGYLIAPSRSIILKKNHTDDDICLDHLNRLNAIPLTINWDTAKMVKNKWKNLAKPKSGELKKDFDKRVRAFNKYDRTAHDVMSLITKEGNRFYLTHRPDKRGRTYSQGYHTNYQGNDWNKAVIELADKEYVE